MDLPDAGIPAIPTSNRLSEGILRESDLLGYPFRVVKKSSLSESFDGDEREVVHRGVHLPVPGLDSARAAR